MIKTKFSNNAINSKYNKYFLTIFVWILYNIGTKHTNINSERLNHILLSLFLLITLSYFTVLLQPSFSRLLVAGSILTILKVKGNLHAHAKIARRKSFWTPQHYGFCLIIYSPSMSIPIAECIYYQSIIIYHQSCII